MTNEIQNTQNIQQTETRSLVERLKARRSVLGKDICLVLDISASMMMSVEPGKLRIDALRDIVNALKITPRTIVFNDHARPLNKDEVIPNPRGGTNMSSAFRMARDLGFKNLLLVTDGEDEFPIDALRAAQGLNIQIMYVGSGDYPDFLENLAKQSGSFCTKEDLLKPKELVDKIQLLLGSGSEETKKGPICL